MAGSGRSVVGSLAVIAAVVGGGAAAFAYTAGWLSPGRLTPERFVAALAPPGGAVPGYRRNHAKGVCFTGRLEADGAGAALSRAPMLAKGSFPVVGRFNFGTPDPVAADSTARVRGLSLSVTAPGGQEWRMAMISAPFFPVSTPEAFLELLVASGKKDDPAAMGRFAQAHPEIARFGAWAKEAPFNESYAQDRFNGLDSFVFTDAGGAERAVRWSFVPTAAAVAIPADKLAGQAADFLEADIGKRVAAGPQRWNLVVTVAEAGDNTADPSVVWPEGRRTVTAGVLVVDRVVPEAAGPCRDLNFDPTVLPSGMRVSDDPFPAARSSVYAVSYDRRTAEHGDYGKAGGKAGGVK